MKIFIGADHHGFEDKSKIEEYLKSLGHQVIDEGDKNLDPNDDFPRYARNVASQVLKAVDNFGILLCGSGQGMCMAANRFKGIRAAMCWDEKSAFASRNDDNANVLCLSADHLNWESMQRIIEVWLNTPFDGHDRFERRIKELDELG